MQNSEFSDATMHRSVYERFDMGEVPDYDAMTEYRPITLATTWISKMPTEGPAPKVTQTAVPSRLISSRDSAKSLAGGPRGPLANPILAMALGSV